MQIPTKDNKLVITLSTHRFLEMFGTQPIGYIIRDFFHGGIARDYKLVHIDDHTAMLEEWASG